jgi:hypothetical protein
MKKIYLFDKWWILPLLSAILFSLFFLFENMWLLLVSLLVIIVSIISLFIKRRPKLGCLTGIILFVYLGLSTVWIVSEILFPDIHHKYAKRYENRRKIQNIIGVKIPRFEVVDSRLIYLKEFDFEFKVEAKIEFKTAPDDDFFLKLDEICALPIPQEPDINSSFFYYSLEHVSKCWSKHGNEYRYVRTTDLGGKLLHSTDAYFYFTITKGSKTAEIVYGNY